MPVFTVIDAKPYHCGRMIRLLRGEHLRSVVAIGLNAHREIRNAFETSGYRKAWLIDGELAGLGGVTGHLLENVGMVWLALSRKATRYPVAVVKEARRQLEQIMAIKDMVYTLVLDGDESARRFAVFLGFQAMDEDGLHPVALSRPGRRTAMTKLANAARFDVGDGSAVAMGYYKGTDICLSSPPLQ